MDDQSLKHLISDSNVTQFLHAGTLIDVSLSIAMNTVGRYVRIQQTSTQVLSLAEVEEMGSVAASSN